MRKKKVLSVLVAFATLAGGAGIAWAVWTVRGTTTAPVHASTAELQASGGTAHDLYPGGYQSTEITVTNSNPYPVQFGRFTIEGVRVDSEHELAGCSGSYVRLDPATTDYNVILGPSSSLPFHVGVGLDPATPESCKGAIFEVTYGATGWVGS